MKRILVDYKKLSHEVAALLIETYPHGYGDSDIIAFKNAKGEIIETVELRTEDTLYLVKISKSLSNFIANFEDAVEKELGDKQLPDESRLGPKDIELEFNGDQDLEEDKDFD
ncbi:hypothetical protein WIW50_12895 [Flavobacteriaceae bacterium 3-367]|uniref:hypothetical protein n=1 Tax=Eudoraea algarum TaxID=3417568 RepID=UPI003284B212